MQAMESTQVSNMVRTFFQDQVGFLVENNIQGWMKNGKQHFAVRGWDVDAEPDSQEWDEARERQKSLGYVDHITLSRNLKTGKIAFALAEVKLPASLSPSEAIGLFEADTLTSRFQFPSPHKPGETPRVVLDTWRTPATHLSLAAAALSSFANSEARHQAYANLFRSLFKDKDDSNIPLGAVDITHTVFGRDNLRNSMVSNLDQARLHASLNSFNQGVLSAVVRHRRIEQEVAAERS